MADLPEATIDSAAVVPVYSAAEEAEIAKSVKKIKAIKWPGSSSAFRKELMELIVKHSLKTKPDSMIAVAANCLGAILAAQDPTKINGREADALIALNLRAGNLASRIEAHKALIGKAAPGTATVPPPSPLSVKLSLGIGNPVVRTVNTEPAE